MWNPVGIGNKQKVASSELKDEEEQTLPQAKATNGLVERNNLSRAYKSGQTKAARAPRHDLEGETVTGNANEVCGVREAGHIREESSEVVNPRKSY